MTNPLQAYFRQPKIFTSLPSKGVYNQSSDFNGSIENFPIYGMTGMDEILLKTPDALFTGDGVVKVLESCCPVIINGWDIIDIDVVFLLIAIRIATYGNKLSIIHTCSECGESSEYDINLSSIIDSLSSKTYKNKIKIGELLFHIKPLSYRDSTQFSIRNFQFRKQLVKLSQNTEEFEKVSPQLVKDVKQLQLDVYRTHVESIETPTEIVTNMEYIKEYIDHADTANVNQLTHFIEQANVEFNFPTLSVDCNSCKANQSINIEINESHFFEAA